MNKRYNLPDGTYWFYGYPSKDKSKKIGFENFLNDLFGPHSINYFYYDTGDETDPTNILGLFTIELKNGQVVSKHWVSIAFDGKERFEEIKKNYPQLSMYSSSKNSYLVNSERGNKVTLTFTFTSGVTECNESCLFWTICDGDQDSNLNPSQILLSCKEFILNKEKYGKSKE